MKKEKFQTGLREERKLLLYEAESLARMGSWKWTERTDQLVWSEGLCNILGKHSDDYVTWDSFLENVIPEDIDHVADCLHRIKTTKNGCTIYYRIKVEEQIHFLSFIVKPQIAKHIDILGAVIDITHQKEYQLALEEHNSRQRSIIKELDEKEKKYRSLFERSIDPIFITSHELMLMDVNNSFLALFDYEDTSGVSVRDIFDNDDQFQFFSHTLMETEQLRDFEVTLVTSRGEKKTCLLNCVFIPDQDSEFCCYQGIVHDLTQRKKSEYDLLAAERLSLTGKIARTIAHEVRNPLTNLNLALDQLRSELPVDNETINLYCDIIDRNSNRIEQLVGEMLNSSKPDKLNLKLVAVNKIIDDTLALAVDRIKLNKVKLVIDCPLNLPRILVDKEKIQIAFLNIIINAIEAMTPERGVLNVRAYQFENTITVQIADNGKGIPTSETSKLFDPFFTCKPNGIGLGLTSTKNILTSHSAQIEVKSELYTGTTFFIHFKLAD